MVLLDAEIQLLLQAMDAQSHLVELVRAIQDEFEGTLTKINQSGTDGGFRESVAEACLSYSDYKSLVRANLLAIDSARSELQERKKEVDEQHLQLQNLLYHKDHLQRSIKTLQEYPLQALRQVENEAGTDQQPLLEGDIGSVKPAHEHSSNQSRLEQEREERRRLHQELESAQEQRKALAKEIEALKETLLVDIPRQVEELHDCARAIQEKHAAAATITTEGPTTAIVEAGAAEASKAGWAGLSAEELASLPAGLYTVLGRIVGYMEALDPETAGRRLSCEVVSSAEHASKHGLSVVAEQTGPEQAAMEVDDEDSTAMASTAGDGPASEGSRPGALLGVSPRAVCLRVSFREEELMPAAGGGGPAVFSVFFYYSPSLRVTLAHCPEDPCALLNLMPMDTGDSASSAAVRVPVKLGEGWRGPRPFRWAQWLSGVMPFPARSPGTNVVLSPEYSSACLLDRLIVRLRARRILDQQLARLQQQAEPPVVLALDPAAGPSLFPDMGSGEKWELSRCVEVSPADLPFKGLFLEDGANEEGEEGEAGGAEGAAPEASEQRGEAGASEGWAQYGARYLEVIFAAASSSSHRKAGSLKAYFQIPAEYPVRPSRVRINNSSSTSSSSGSSSTSKKSSSSSSSSSSSNNVNPFKNIEVEVNAHYDELLADHPTAHDWLLPHQLRRLSMCLNVAADSSTQGGVGQRRWGKDRRRPYTLDVQARQLMPR